jgi:hypothetical protein
MIRSIRALAAVHLAGNALLLWLAYYWLGIGESRTATLVWSAFIALLVIILACGLHGATITYFREQAFGITPLRLLILMATMIAVLALYWVVARWNSPIGRAIVAWGVIPLMALPLFVGRLSLFRNWRHWIQTPLLVLCAVWLPLRLMSWVPKPGSGGMEMASFILRFGAAYLLFLASWLLLLFLASGGRPVFSQPKTVSSP